MLLTAESQQRLPSVGISVPLATASYSVIALGEQGHLDSLLFYPDPNVSRCHEDDNTGALSA